MSTSDWRDAVTQKVRVLQVIFGVIVLGSCMYLVVAVLLTLVRQPAVDRKMLSYICLAIAAASFFVWLIVPYAVVAQERKKIGQDLLNLASSTGDTSTDNKIEMENKLAAQLLMANQTKTIMSCALLEGNMFLLLTAYILQAYIPCVITAGVLLLLLIAQMPTVGRVSNWVEKQMRIVLEETALIQSRTVVASRY